MRKAKRAILAVAAIFAIIIVSYGLSLLIRKFSYQKENVPVAVNIESIKPTTTSVHRNLPINAPIIKTVAPEIPKELNLAMMFYSQAPFVDWSEPWQNACEEASILLVANTYYNHYWTKEQFRDQILALVGWENKNFGDYKSTNAQQISKMLEDFLKLKSIIHINPTFEDVQKILSHGHLIVMTFDGRELGNPFFTNGGPDYHALVIKGYKEGEKVITEDVGTQHGENYVYTWKTLINANHDYTTPIANGAKVMIEVLPPQK